MKRKYSIVLIVAFFGLGSDALAAALRPAARAQNARKTANQRARQPGKRPGRVIRALDRGAHLIDRMGRRVENGLKRAKMAPLGRGVRKLTSYDTLSKTSVEGQVGVRATLPADSIPYLRKFPMLGRLVSMGPWLMYWSGNLRQAKEGRESPKWNLGVTGESPLVGLRRSTAAGRGMIFSLPMSGSLIQAMIDERQGRVVIGNQAIFMLRIGKYNWQNEVNRDAAYFSIGWGSPFASLFGLPILSTSNISIYSPLLDPLWNKVGEPLAKWIQKKAIRRAQVCKDMACGVRRGPRRVWDRLSGKSEVQEEQQTTSRSGF